MPAPPGSRAQAGEAVQSAFIGGFNEILLVGAVIAFVGGVLAFVLTRERDFVAAPGAEPAAA